MKSNHPEDKKDDYSFAQLFRFSAFKAYFFLSIIVMLLLLFFSYSLTTKEEKIPKNTEIMAKQARIEKLEEELQAVRELQKADSEFIMEGNYEGAMEIYAELKGNEYLQADLSDRIEQIKMMTASRSGSKEQEERTTLMIRQKNQELASLKSELEQVKKEKNKELDSLANQVIKLQKELNKKEDALKRKEKVRVITFVNENDKKIHYLGEVENNKANGGGVGIFPSGNVYKGDWVNNKRHGTGRIESNNGEVYEGDWKNGIREGEGVYKWPSGEKYEGEWKNNERNGFGILYDRDNNIQFEGEWKNGKPIRN